MKIRKLLRVPVFVILLVLFLILSGRLLRPVWYDWNNYHTTHDFYLEPDNRIEAVFLGSSVVVNGISPMQLYEEYGLCAYNLATEQQPVSASWVWLQEVYRLHQDTLKTVVIDASMLTHEPESSAFFLKAIDRMRNSTAKQEALHEYAKDENDWISLLFPLFHYHDRWKELEPTDWKQDESINSTRGYNLVTERWIDCETAEDPALPQYGYDPDCDATELAVSSLEYFDRIVSFCHEHQLQLVLSKAPTANWSSSAHKAIQELAGKHQIQFFDFNFTPYIDQLDFRFLLDLTDGHHMNCYGAKKYTHWWGEWLSGNSECENKKGKSGYEYLETQLTAYRKQSMAAVELADCRDVTEYIRYAKSIENSAVLMAVCDEGTDALTEEQKKKMEEDGLGKLARLNYRDSYVAYIQDGEVVFEMDQRDADSAENADASLSVDFLLPRKQRVNMQSCGTGHGDAFSSITVDGVEYCLNQRGINIVVYDYLNGAVVNSTCFDTCVSPYREADYETRYAHALKNGTPADAMDEKLRELYLYNRRYDNWKQVYQWRTESSSMSFFSWLEPWISSKGYTVFISVMDEASDSLTEDNRDGMLGLGLAALSGIEYRDSYIGIINDGSVSYEELDHGYEPIEWSGVDCLVKSGGMDSGNVSSVMICGNEYSISMRGLNCVVYDKELKEVVDTVAFDTFAAPIDMEYKMRDDFI